MKMKNEEEKNQLLVELVYNYHFHISETSILQHGHCENFFEKYFFSQKIELKFDQWLTQKIIKKI